MSLPSGYTWLEYIESTGAQYIDTGFKPNNNTRVVMDITPVSVDGTHLFGSRSSNSASDYFLLLCTGGHYRDDYAADKLVTTITPSGRVVIDKNKNSITIGGTTSTHTAASFTGAYPIALLASNTGGRVTYFTKAKLYSCRIYSNGTLVRDFIPCKNASGVVGLWDDANSQFYANAGSGAFTAGPVYVGTHKTLISGTLYDVKGGKCLVNGTAYSIKKGRTLIGGTGYDITFEKTVGKTWVINEHLYASAFNTSYWFNARFVSNGRVFYGFFAQWVSYDYQMGYFTKVDQSTYDQTYAMNTNETWSWVMGEAYRTITFYEPPTGDLLTWLQANATPQ